MPNDQIIKDGDCLKIRGENYEVLGVCNDGRGRYCVRFTRDFKQNVNNAHFSIMKPPTFEGILLGSINLHWNATDRSILK